MYVAASRRRHLPCVGVVRRFGEQIESETLVAYAAELAANPEGFGRRVVPARLPGARQRWEPAAILPPLRVETEPLPSEVLAALLDEEVSTQPDPTCDPGWRLTALNDSEGGTTVVTWLNHAYGDGRGILETAFAPAAVAVDRSAVPRRQTMHELGDVVGRFRRGIVGGARLGREAATVGWRQPASDLARLGPALAALRTRDRSVGGRSRRRVAALARVEADAWEATAADHGGSSNALLLAVLANLLRLARQSRGEAHERPLRLLLPFDTRLAGGGAGSPVEPATANAAGAAVVVLPGGTPSYGRLDAVRAATREALRRASATAAATRAAAPPGVVDVMALLPSAITHRVASRVQANVDGVASNVGPIPPHVAQLGRHTAREVFLLAGPMLTDLTVCLGSDRAEMAVGVVADPARLGPAGGLRDRLAEELAGWGLAARVN
jgi:diacylglycerol O-acyltransferase / wax synthase